MMSVQEEEPTLDPDLSRETGSASGASTAGEPGAEAPVGEPLLEEPPLEEPPAPSPPVTEPPVETAEGQFLEELSVPLETPAERDGLAPGTVLESPAGPLTLGEPLGAEAGVQRYRAELPEGPVRLSEAAGPAGEPLRRQAELLAALQSPMFPRAVTAFERDDRFYLVTEEVVGTTLAEALAEGTLPFPQVVSVLAQVAHAVKQMHAAGWAHLGLRPSGVVLGRPARLVDLSFATRLGDRRPLPATHVDTLEQVTGEPTLELQPGDVLLLCSDGLWEPVVEEQMQRTVRAHASDLAAAADELVRLALQAGGPDNIAVLLFRLDQGAPAEEKRAC